MFAWGSTINGELGLDETDEVEHVLKPRKLECFGADSVVEVACGDTHTLLLTKNGKVYSCGSNDYGQLGHDQPRKRQRTSLFNLVTGLDGHRITQISCGIYHSMALNQSGQVFTWGSDACGQLGHQLERAVQAIPKLLETLVGLRVVQISSGRKHSLALTAGGEIYAWGANNYGQLGIRTVTPYEAVPLTVSTLDGIPIASIACGGYHTFAVSRSGAVFGWGKNSQGQLGLNDTELKHFPNQLQSLKHARVCYISCGHEFSTFLTLNGTIFTCGGGMYGQLGHGSVSNEILPRGVSELMGSAITQVSCGHTHTLVLVASGERVYSFGFGAAGQLGIGSSSNAATPQLVQDLWVTPSGSNVVESLQPHSIINRIFAGGHHCFATITESSNHTPFDYRQFLPETQIFSLSCYYLNKCLDVSPNESVDQDMLEYLETVFKSVACINRSFLLPNEEHYCCTSEHHGVDLKLAEDTFSLIENFENQSIIDVIWKSITEVLLKKLPASPIDPEALRIYLILPMYHEFCSLEHHQKLHKPFCRALLSLQSMESEIISNWLRSTTCYYFERLVLIYKDVVSYIIRKQKIPPTGTIRDDPSLHDALEMLMFLYKINFKPESAPKVTYDTFHLPELSQYVTIDYLLWTAQPDSVIVMPNCVSCRNYHQGDEGLFLCDYPFLFDARAKIKLLKSYQLDTFYAEFSEDSSDFESYSFELSVTRENIVEDTLGQLLEFSSFELWKNLKVSFVGEEAEDGGGVKKEFFVVFAEEVLDPKYGLFKEYEETRTIWFSSESTEDKTTMYYLVGLIFGLAIYNFSLINLPFPLALYKKLLHEPITLEDLEDLSPTVANSLLSILDYMEPDLEEVFLINFEITCDICGEKRAIPLKENGDKIPVSQNNKEEYVDLYLDFIFNTSIKEQYQAFSDGFKKVCGDDLSYLFRTQELMSVAIGNEDYDWCMLEEVAEYAEGYRSSDETIRWFWEVIHEMSLEDKKKFLLFLTGCDRLPVGGMQAIKIEIGPGNADEYLPVAHTCFNSLDLPRYKTKEILREKLLQAIWETRGFSLF